MSVSGVHKPGKLQTPHPELATQHPLIFVVAAGETLYRHHRKALDPVFYGKKGDYRFDDPICPDGLPDLLYQFIVSVARRVLLISRRSRGCGEVGSA
jgi:hypothetical protein